MDVERRIVVLNFGANIMVNASLRDAAVARVRGALERAQTPIVVCSPAPTPAGGEVRWTGRFVDAIAAAGIRAVALTRTQIGIQPADPNAAVDVELIGELLDQGIVPVVTGAMPHGSGSRGKRRGSDLAAIVLASAMSAASVVVYTTEDGVFSADPERVQGATPVTYVGYTELMELADSGASVVSAAAAELARARSVRYELRGLASDVGSAVREDAWVERARKASSVSATSDIALLTVRISKGRALQWERTRNEMLETLAKGDIAIEMLQFLPAGARFVCARKHLPTILDIVRRLGMHAKALEACTRIVLVGSGLRTSAGVFYRLLKTLTDAQIGVLHFADSNVTISVVVAERDGLAAERVAHEEIVLGGAGAAAELALRFESETDTINVRGRAHHLGDRQARLLRYFLENGGRVIETGQLAQAVFGEQSPSTIAALRVHVHNLRKKIEEDPDAPRHVITVPNRGYMFVR